MKKRIFISSVQREFAEERQRLKRYIEANPILRRFFEVFVFEMDVPPTDMRTDEVYLAEVAKCDVYVALIGRDYGFEDAAGVSPTEREYDEATRLGKRRIVLVNQECDAARSEKEAAFLKKISAELTWHGYNNENELLNWLIAALDKVLSDEKVYRELPFDISPCDTASMNDIDTEKVKEFLRVAREERKLDLPGSASVDQVFESFQLYADGNRTLNNAAILLFGKHPQRFHISSEVKCVHWHGVERIKPILSYQIYKGTLFEMIDMAIEFVMARIDRSVGTRRESSQAPVKYDIPRSVIAEAIANAVAHRDYYSTGSVQVELYADRLEVCNPGTINPGIKKEQLTVIHRSFPNNPIIADPLFYTRHIDKIGSGLTDLIDECREAGLPDPKIEVGETTYMITIYRKKKAFTDNSQIAADGNGGVSGGVNGGLNDGVNLLFEAIRSNPGLRAPALAKLLDAGVRTIERHLSALGSKIEFRGAPKTGGYYIKGAQ